MLTWEGDYSIITFFLFQLFLGKGITDDVLRKVFYALFCPRV